MVAYKRRFFTFVLVICLFLVSCSSVGEIPSSSPATLTSPITTLPSATPTNGPTSLITSTQEVGDFLPSSLPQDLFVEFWHPWSGELANLISQLTDEFNHNNSYGITVNSTAHSDQRVLIEDFEKGRLEGWVPDLVAAPTDYLTLLVGENFQLRDLNEFITSEKWGLDEASISSFFPVFWNANENQEQRWGVPAYWSGYYLFYNKSWGESLGFSERPFTVEEFKDQACAAALNNLYDGNPDSNGTGGYIYSYDALAMLSWLKAYGGGSVHDSNASVQFGSPEDVDASEFLFDLYLIDCAWTGRQPQPYQYFSDRLALFYSGNLEEIIVQDNINRINDSDDMWTLIPYPYKKDKPVVLLEGFSYAIPTPDIERATASWIFVKWLLEPQNQARMVEATAGYPLSSAALPYLDTFRKDYPAWDEALQFLALAEPAPINSKWQLTRDILSDYAWQLVRFTTQREDIPDILRQAEEIFEQ